MNEKNKIPQFPDLPIPDKITQGEFCTIEDKDIQSDKDLEELIKLMYDKPYATFKFYSTGENPYIAKAIRDGRIFSDTIESYYYKHPKFERDYIKIHNETASFDWEKSVAETEPMFFKRILILTEKERKNIDREIDSAYLKNKMTLMEKISKHPFFIVIASIASILGLILTLIYFIKPIKE